MTSENENVKWCPMGRVSVQQIENGRVTAMQAGAFNLTLYGGDGGRKIYFSSTCIKSRCPYYRRGWNPWGWGRCALAVIDYRPWFTLVLALVLVFIFLWWRQG